MEVKHKYPLMYTSHNAVPLCMGPLLDFMKDMHAFDSAVHVCWQLLLLTHSCVHLVACYVLTDLSKHNVPISFKGKKNCKGIQRLFLEHDAV